MLNECLLVSPEELEIRLHPADMLACATPYSEILSQTIKSWKFIKEFIQFDLGMIKDGLSANDVVVSLELYNYNFLHNKYNLVGSVKVKGIVEDENDFSVLLDIDTKTNHLFLNKLSKTNILYIDKSEVNYKMKFQDTPYSQNGSDLLFFNGKQIFFMEMKLWKK